jgi:hypothetical protein
MILMGRERNGKKKKDFSLTRKREKRKRERIPLKMTKRG